MSDELRAARERLLRFCGKLPTDPKWKPFAEDLIRICNAIEIPPADDELPIDEAWLRDIGFEENSVDPNILVIKCKDYCHPMIHTRYLQVAVDTKTWEWFTNGLGCRNQRSRGDLRRLLAALGVG